MDSSKLKKLLKLEREYLEAGIIFHKYINALSVDEIIEFGQDESLDELNNEYTSELNKFKRRMGDFLKVELEGLAKGKKTDEINDMILTWLRDRPMDGKEDLI